MTRATSCVALRATRQVDWWTKAKPDDIVRQDTQIETVFVLEFEQGAARLVVDTALSDEKGQVQLEAACD